MSNKALPSWVDKLSNIKMPVLSAVISQLNRLTGDDDAEVNQLAKVILKDSNLTSQILRIANSIQYNPSNNNINTVSRAIVLLGFRNIRSLCISLMVIDTLLEKEPRERLLQIMTKAFHAAVQARSILKKVNQKHHEEVFIAALLHNVGEMAFWAYGGQVADDLDQTLPDFLQCRDVSSAHKRLIEKELGISFKNLSRELGKAWNLGETLQEALSSSHKVSDRAQAVRLGEAISQLAENDKNGRLELVKQVADFTKQSKADSGRLIDDATESAADVALEYGVPQVRQFMSMEKVDRSEKRETPQVLSIDRNLQLKILRELDSSIAGKVDVNTIFQMALEGIHKGVGLERVVLAFFRQGHIKAKYILGQYTEDWREQFAFDVKEGTRTIFADCLHKTQPVWLDEDYIKAHEQCYTDKILSLIGKRSAFIGVLRVNGRHAALFYADRGHTQELLSNDQFDMFKHFLSRAETTVQIMANT